MLTNSGTIRGGGGGAGSDGTDTGIGSGGYGGSGGIGISASGGATITNQAGGTIRGGAFGTGFVSGNGGTAVQLSKATLTNAGMIVGGSAGDDIFAGFGGAGVSGDDMTVTNVGYIAGSNGADAIAFTGGANVLALGSAATFTGALDIQAGTLTFDQSVGAAANVPADITLADTIIGAGAVIKAGSGTLTLNAANTYAGGTSFNAGTVRIADDNRLGATSGALTFNGGTLETTASFTIARAITLTALAPVQVDAGGLTLAGVISGTGTFAKTGTGTLALTGANTYAGGTRINAGTLKVTSDGNLGATSGALTVADGTLETTGTFASARAITLGGTSGNNIVQVDAGTTTLSGSISGGVFGQLKKTGSGTLVLSGANTFSGNLFVNAGTLSISSGGNLGSGSSNLFLAGGTLETTATLSEGRATILNADGTVQVDTGTATLSGIVSGSHAFSKTGAGTLVLSGANSYSVRTTIAAGTLSIGSDGNLGATSAELTFAGGKLETTATLTSGRTIGLNADGNVQVDTGTTTFTNVVRGTFAVVKSGAGTLVLSGTNTYSGGTTISAGTLSIGADGNLGAASGGIVFAGGVLETSGSFGSKRTVRFDDSGTFQVDDGKTTLSQLSGSHGFFKTGAGTLELSGTNTYQGNSTISAGTLSVGSDASLGASSSDIVLAGGTLETTGTTFTSARAVKLNATGTVQVDSGTSTFSGVVAGPQLLVKTGNGTLRLSGANIYSGGTTIAAGTLDLAAAAAAGTGQITFAGPTNRTTTLVIEAPAAPSGGGTFANTLAGFGTSDALDLTSLAYSAGATATYDAANSRLVVTSGSVTQYFTLASPTSQTFYAHQDAAGTGTLVDTVCFAQGTRIRTPHGEVPVEHLKIGDVAVTAAGGGRPIVWLGHRTIDCRRHPRPHDAQPVRIAAHAFGPGLPTRDLWLSPGHPVLVGADADNEGGHLVPIMCLINGTTITREPVDEVTYWHVELDAHDILLADNLPAESYLDWGDRAFFGEAADHALANPDFVVPGLAGRCRPVALDGPLVEAEQRRLDMVFITRLADACGWPSAETRLDI